MNISRDLWVNLQRCIFLQRNKTDVRLSRWQRFYWRYSPASRKPFSPSLDNRHQKWRAAAQLGRTSLTTAVGVFIRTICDVPEALGAGADVFKVDLRLFRLFPVLFLCMAYLLLHLFGSKCLCASSTLCCVFLISRQFPNHAETSG